MEPGKRSEVTLDWVLGVTRVQDPTKECTDEGCKLTRYIRIHRDELPELARASPPPIAGDRFQQSIPNLFADRNQESIESNAQLNQRPSDNAALRYFDLLPKTDCYTTDPRNPLCVPIIPDSWTIRNVWHIEWPEDFTEFVDCSYLFCEPHETYSITAPTSLGAGSRMAFRTFASLSLSFLSLRTPWALLNDSSPFNWNGNKVRWLSVILDPFLALPAADPHGQRIGVLLQVHLWHHAPRRHHLPRLFY